MKILRAWPQRLGGMFTSEQREQEFASELQGHLQLHPGAASGFDQSDGSAAG